MILTRTRGFYPKAGKGTIAGYNVQIAVDDKHKLLIACEVTSEGNDTHQLEPMAMSAKAVLEVDTLKVAADSGYYNQEQIYCCEKNGIIPYVAIPDNSSAIRASGRYERADFYYDAEQGAYVCPAGKLLKQLGSEQILHGKRMIRYRSKVSQCKVCPLREHCLPEKTAYRQLYRWLHEDSVERHQQRMATAGKAYMRRRAALAEHPGAPSRLEHSNCGADGVTLWYAALVKSVARWAF